MNIISYITNKLPIQKNKVVFYTFSDSYGNGPKYVAEQLLKKDKKYDLVWVSHKKRVRTPKRIRSVCGQILMYYHLSTAKIIISDTRLGKYWASGFIKKAAQVYYQIEHEGSFGMKKTESDVHNAGATDNNLSRLDSLHIDYLFSNSKWLTESYRYCYYYSGKILEIGAARNDILLNSNNNSAELRRKLGLQGQEKILLYAPTRREWDEKTLHIPDFNLLRKAVEKQFGGEWIVFVRSHPDSERKILDNNKLYSKACNKFVRDVSSYPDMSELLVCADILLSDFSSSLFDFLLTHKPSFSYAPDIESFKANHGLYLDPENTPIPFARNMEQLVYNIEHFDNISYRKNVDEFLRNQGNVEDGRAAQRIADLVNEDIIREKRNKSDDVYKAQHKETLLNALKKHSSKKNKEDVGDSSLLALNNLPIQENRIVFRSVMGGYSCNVKYIAEKIIKQGLPYELIWIVNTNALQFDTSFPKQIKLIPMRTPAAYEAYATCKLRVDSNMRFALSDPIRQGIRKKKGQVHIQTWHGHGGPKKALCEAHMPMSDELIYWAKKDAADVDYFISNSRWLTNYFKRTFWDKGIIKEYGYPRNDIFFQNDKDDIRRRILTQLGINDKQKLLLYAPTWRADKKSDSYILEFKEIIKALSNRFGGEWNIAVRLHHEMFSLRKRILQSDAKVISVSEYADMQELLISADVLITDYSSCMHDYMFLKRPIFLYVKDNDKYETSTGMYYHLDETPFDVSTNMPALLRSIRGFNEKEYAYKLDAYIKSMGSVEDGHAAKRVVELIKSIINNKI